MITTGKWCEMQIDAVTLRIIEIIIWFVCIAILMAMAQENRRR